MNDARRGEDAGCVGGEWCEGVAVGGCWQTVLSWPVLLALRPADNAARMNKRLSFTEVTCICICLVLNTCGV